VKTNCCRLLKQPTTAENEKRDENEETGDVVGLALDSGLC